MAAEEEITMETGKDSAAAYGIVGLTFCVCSGFPLGLLVMLLIAIGASFASGTKLKNHDNLVNCKQEQVLARWH